MTPDGYSRLELATYLTPPAIQAEPPAAYHTVGMHRVVSASGCGVTEPIVRPGADSDLGSIVQVPVLCRRYRKHLHDAEISARPWAHLETTDGLLRRPDPADAHGVFAVHSDPRVYQHDPHETHPDLTHTEAFLAPMLDHWSRHGFGYWTVLAPDQVWKKGSSGRGPGTPVAASSA